MKILISIFLIFGITSSMAEDKILLSDLLDEQRTLKLNPHMLKNTENCPEILTINKLPSKDGAPHVLLIDGDTTLLILTQLYNNQPSIKHAPKNGNYTTTYFSSIDTENSLSLETLIVERNGMLETEDGIKPFEEILSNRVKVTFKKYKQNIIMDYALERLDEMINHYCIYKMHE